MPYNRREPYTRQGVFENYENQNQDLGEIVSRILDSTTNALEDGINRILPYQESAEKGFLVISPERIDEQNRHIALKVNDNTFWTISAPQGGEALEIGILENNEYRSVIQFNRDEALTLSKRLQLSNGLAYTNGEKKGIFTSGFKGFEEGELPPNGRWQILKPAIPKNTFGKYRIQAWLIDNQNKNYANLQYTFAFYPDGTVSLPSFWDLKKENIESGITMRSEVNRFFNIFRKNVTPRLRATVKTFLKMKKDDKYDASDQYNEDDLVIAIRSTENVDGSIYYTLERLWEGSDWIDK